MSRDDVGSDRPIDGMEHRVQPSELRTRLAFLELGEDDRERLKALDERLHDVREQFVEGFYAHLFKFESTAKFLQDPELVERLKRAQVAHLDAMLAADWQEEHLERCFRVGDVHARVGISPQIFLGAYNQYLKFCMEVLVADEGGGAMHECAAMMRSVQKAVLLDIGLTLDAYFSRTTANLRRALDLVYQANAELRQFAQLTSHDLKTPLATMVNLCDEALDEFQQQIPGEAAKLIVAARNRALRMSSTIDELLQSSLSLHEEQTPEAVPVREVLSETIELLRPLLEQKKIELTLPPRMPAVRGNRVRLREVLFNLLSNAIKYNDKTAGKIVVSSLNDGKTCTISISDNGPGIPREDLTRIFVPFRRLGVHRDVPGSGLGLYFAKTLVEQQGGRIWADSQHGQGSTFHISMALANQDAT
jgi:signal transduction histidine kinase